MLAVNFSTIRNNFKDYCDRVADIGETVIITRKNEKNVVFISLDQYNDLERAARNVVYLTKLDRALAQFDAGKCVQHNLIEVNDE